MSDKPKVEKANTPARSPKFPDGVDGFDVRGVFAHLTQQTTPRGFEWMQYHDMLTNAGFELDKSANYQGTILKADGSMPETIFIAHMDTVGSVPPKRINQIVDGDIMRTDGTTNLGADDKAGMTVLLYLLHKRVPGFYLFVWGEETGREGSRALTNKYSFATFKRAIAFDRRDTNSIITVQSGQTSCSDEFATALAEQLNAHGLNMRSDPTGSFTDTFSFFGEVPECTNISVGYTGAHGNTEQQDLAFLEDLCYAAGRVNWEELPTVQDTKQRYRAYKNASANTYQGGAYQRNFQEWDTDGGWTGSRGPYNYSASPKPKGAAATAAPPASLPKVPASNAAKGRKNGNDSKTRNAIPFASDDELTTDEQLATLSEQAQAELEEAQEAWDTITYLNDHRMLDYDTVESFFIHYPEAACHALMTLVQASPFVARQHAIDVPESSTTAR
jgi:hypothetical protein